MTTMRNITGIVDDGSRAVHLLLRKGVRVLAGSPEKVVADIESRANTIGCVLEDILHESHGSATKLDE